MGLARDASRRRGPARALAPASAGQRQDRRRDIAVQLALLGRDRLGARAHGAHQAGRGGLGLLHRLGGCGLGRHVLSLGRRIGGRRLGLGQHAGRRLLPQPRAYRVLA